MASATLPACDWLGIDDTIRRIRTRPLSKAEKDWQQKLLREWPEYGLGEFPSVLITIVPTEDK